MGELSDLWDDMLDENGQEPTRRFNLYLDAQFQPPAAGKTDEAPVNAHTFLLELEQRAKTGWAEKSGKPHPLTTSILSTAESDIPTPPSIHHR